MKKSELTNINIKDLKLLDYNPRKVKKEDFERLVKSIRTFGFLKHRPLAVEQDKDGKYVILCGNQRYKAAKKLRIKEIPCIIYSELEHEERVKIITTDNDNVGQWNFEILGSADEFRGVNFDFMGVDFLTGLDEEKEKNIKDPEPKSQTDIESSEEDEELNDADLEGYSEEDEKRDFYRRMYKDVLFDFNNKMEIPNLLLEMQAGKLELPFSPWGANSRLRKDVTTYHFYVDDYRFEALFKDPSNLLMSGCSQIVEPNCSCHDQTPIAWGLQLIYKKRWLSRYLQEFGIKVYADLNVSHKFIEYNRMGIPEGYNAFMTRGTDGWIESMKSDLQVAQEISGLEKPNLIVYAGGEEIKEFCYKYGLLYVTDFINAKKEDIHG